MNETTDMDSLAAEYVLGTLESGERTQALALMTIDPGFVEKIRLWERRLSELHLMVEPIEPDGKIWERIKPKIPGASEVPPAPAADEAMGAPAGVEDSAPSGVFDDLPEAVTASLAAEPELPAPIPSLPVDADIRPQPVPVPTPSPSVTPPLIPERVTTVTAKPQAPRPATGRGRLRVWQGIAAVMTVIALGFVGLFAAWHFAPDRLPPALRPLAVMRDLGVSIPSAPAPRPPAPPDSQFDE
jgi:hypothetical protein